MSERIDREEPSVSERIGREERWVSERIDWVLGTGRCGSTLVHEVLCRHAGVAFLSNLEDRGRLLGASAPHNRRIYDRLPASFTRKGRLRFAPSEGYALLERDVSPLVVDPMRDLTAADATPWLADRLRSALAGRARPGERFVHKFTGWPRAGMLDAVFPDGRYVNVVRDGRAVANSWLQMDWWRGHRGPDEWHFGPLPPDLREIWEGHDRSFVVLAGLAWRLLLDAYDEAAEQLPGRWLELRYEDVVAEPSVAFERLVEFLELEPDPSFADAVARHPFSAGRAEAFRTDLGDRHVAALDEVLGEHLAGRGYRV